MYIYVPIWITRGLLLYKIYLFILVCLDKFYLPISKFHNLHLYKYQNWLLLTAFIKEYRYKTK